MATATRQSRAARKLGRRAAGAGVQAMMEFEIFEDNGGAYHWRIVAGVGETLAQSGGFASYDEAEQAARRVRKGAALGRFEPRAAEELPVDLMPRRDASTDNSDATDNLDAERWLNEGGSFRNGLPGKGAR